MPQTLHSLTSIQSVCPKTLPSISSSCRISYIINYISCLIWISYYPLPYKEVTQTIIRGLSLCNIDIGLCRMSVANRPQNSQKAPEVLRYADSCSFIRGIMACANCLLYSASRPARFASIIRLRLMLWLCANCLAPNWQMNST